MRSNWRSIPIRWRSICETHKGTSSLRHSGWIYRQFLRNPCLEIVSSQIKGPIDESVFGNFSALIPALDRLQPECLVPILSRAGDLLGLIVLGAKRSEEPYSREDKQLLGSVASHAGMVLESIELAEKMAERIEKDRRAEQELRIARAVQSKLFRSSLPHWPLWTMREHAFRLGRSAVIIMIFSTWGRDGVGFVLADIAGKGISAALLMANLQASLRSLYPSPSEELPRLPACCEALFVKNTEITHYATVFFGVYDDVTRKLMYVNCGHNPPLCCGPTSRWNRLEATATVLGLFEPWDCSVAEVQLFQGDILAIYTDGITEASNRDEEEFGEERLISLLRLSKGLSAAELLHQIHQVGSGV